MEEMAARSGTGLERTGDDPGGCLAAPGHGSRAGVRP